MQSDSLEDRKGEAIRLIGGSAKKHRNYTGAWLDLGKAPTRCFYHIIVEKPDPEDPDRTYLDSFKASKSNVIEPEALPQTYIQAAFQQIPQLSERLNDFARMVAKCRIKKCRELSDRIGAAIDREIRNLLLKGSSAEYRIVDTTGLPDIVPDVDE